MCLQCCSDRYGNERERVGKGEREEKERVQGEGEVREKEMEICLCGTKEELKKSEKVYNLSVKCE